MRMRTRGRLPSLGGERACVSADKLLLARQRKFELQFGKNLEFLEDICRVKLEVNYIGMSLRTHSLLTSFFLSCLREKRGRRS